MFIEELIEKLKSGSVWCWTRGGGLIEIKGYNPEKNYPFWSSHRTWSMDGKFNSDTNDELDIIAICLNPALIQEQYKRDTQRVPVAGDWVVWIGSDGYLKNGEVLQVESVSGQNMVLVGKDCYGRRWCENWRYATTEEIAAAQQPEFREGVYRLAGVIGVLQKCEHRHHVWSWTVNGRIANRFGKQISLSDGFEFVAPLPPDGYELRVLKQFEEVACESFCEFSINDGKEWTRYDWQMGGASGIENGWLYAFPKAEPAQPTQPNEQACSTLVMVCRGLTTKGTT